MKMKTNELTGVALDWAVATCEGFPIRHDPMNFGPAFAEGGFWIWDDRGPIGKRDYRLIGRQYCPSSNWSLAGPIIEREGITVREITPIIWKTGVTDRRWIAEMFRFPGGPRRSVAYGITPLVAAMRCYVVSKLGYEIDVPECLF